MMEKRLHCLESNKSNEYWLEARSQSKVARKEEASVIKEFVDYATTQGSKNSKHYYKHITNATYKALGLMSQRKPHPA